MDQVDLWMGLTMMAAAFGTAWLALWALSRLGPQRRVRWDPLSAQEDSIVYLFEDDLLVDATPRAEGLLRGGPPGLDDFSRLTAVLAPRFPDFRPRMANLAERQTVALDDGAGTVLTAEWRGGLARITLQDGETGPGTPGLDGFGLAAMEEELATLRAAVNAAPILAWMEDEDGRVRWANGPYVEAAEALTPEGESLGWPLPRLFDQRAPGADPGEQPRRLALQMPEGPAWFYTWSAPRAGHGLAAPDFAGQGHTGPDGVAPDPSGPDPSAVAPEEEAVMLYAVPADRLVRAEASLREFVQTLTKTFAHLPIGLAVFDRQRRLALFNPALTDLSALEPQFLSARPSLHEFLDRLRERQRMPEPKDYKSWRTRISELEAAAASGPHVETWSLASGHTYRVTGRPHPDGALAFLFEDISSEISLTRRFRSELELGQAVVDRFEDAIAVFSSTGALILSNAAYDALWGVEPNETLGEISVVDATRLWQARCLPTPVLGEIRSFVDQPGERAPWAADLRRQDGTALHCSVAPIAGHATLVRFAEPPAAGTRPPPTLVTGKPSASHG